MRLKFGRYQGLTTEVLLLRLPDYAQWMMIHAEDGAVARQFHRLVERLDAKPWRAACQACGAPATEAFAYVADTRLLFRCATCPIYADADGISVLKPIGGFATALNHVDGTLPRGRRKAKRRIIRGLSIAKGGPRRITEASARSFFCEAFV